MMLKNYKYANNRNSTKRCFVVVMCSCAIKALKSSLVLEKSSGCLARTSSQVHRRHARLVHMLPSSEEILSRTNSNFNSLED